MDELIKLVKEKKITPKEYLEISRRAQIAKIMLEEGKDYKEAEKINLIKKWDNLIKCYLESEK